MFSDPTDQSAAPQWSRRRMLRQCSSGFGAVALSALLREAAASETTPPAHHVAKAKHVIFCYMSGGVSHVDTFDPKPALKKLHGQPMPVTVERTQFNNNGNIMASPFEFTVHGESGIPVSSMFPELASVVDEMAIVRSMTTPVNEHAQGNFFMHSGFPFMGHPSAGAWCSVWVGLGEQRFAWVCGAAKRRRGASPWRRRAVQQRFSAGAIPGLHHQSRQRERDSQHPLAGHCASSSGGDWTLPSRSTSVSCSRPATMPRWKRRSRTTKPLSGCRPLFPNSATFPTRPNRRVGLYGTRSNGYRKGRLRATVPAGPTTGRTRRPFRRTELFDQGHRCRRRGQSLGPARRSGERPRCDGFSSRPANCRIDQGPAPAWPVGTKR